MNIEQILKSWQEQADECLEKAKKDVSKLIPVKKQVTKNGKSYMTTVYVSPKEAESIKPDKKAVNPSSLVVPEIGEHIEFKKPGGSPGETQQGIVLGLLDGKYKVLLLGSGTEIVSIYKKDVLKILEENTPKKAEPKKEEPKKAEPKGKIPAVDANKNLRPIRKALGTEKYKEYLKAHGITWKENKENQGADTMRASSAAKKFLEGGGKLDKELFNHMLKGGTVDDFKKKADEEAKKKADEEAKKKADEEAKKKADEPKSGGKKPAVDINKQLRPIRKALGTAKYKEFLKANGISWEENKENEGADTMRASSAAKKFLESGKTLDMDLYEHMKNGGKVSDYKKAEPKAEEPKAEEPKAKPKKKTKKEELEALGDYFKPISAVMKSKFKQYEDKADKSPELKEFFEGLKTVATQEDFDALLKAKGTNETKVTFQDLTWEMRKHMNAKKGLFGVKGYKYGFEQTAGKLGNTLNTNTEPLTGVKLKYIKNYTGSGYASLNKYLRDLGSGKEVEKDENLEEFAKKVNEVLLDDETSTNVMLFRGIKPPPGSDIENMVTEIKNGNLDKYIGYKMTDNGFASTSVKAGKQFSGSLQLQIKAPKGTKGKYINEYSNYKDIEYEFLLPSGTSFEIEQIKVVNDQVKMLVSVVQK